MELATDLLHKTHFLLMLHRFLVLLLLMMAGLANLPGANYALVAEFERPGELPSGRLLYVPSAGKYFGTTVSGGAHGKGTVFSVDASGSRTTLVSFSGVDGPNKGEAPAGGLVAGPDGLLYGVTEGGGADDCGTIFRMGVGGNLTTLIEFTGAAGSARGAFPNELHLFNGTFYGTTQAGGSADHGTMFRLNLPLIILPPLLVPTIDTLVQFTGTGGTARGSMPVGALVSSGTSLFGVTSFGGVSDCGVVFRYNTAIGGGYNYLTQFTGTAGSRPGANPAAGLVVHPDGLLYGTTEFGGANDEGTVFRVTTTGSEGGAAMTSMLHFDFDNGAQPSGALLVGADLALYGTTSFGGAEGKGTIFRLSNSSPFDVTTIGSFTGVDGSLPGEDPRAGLAAGAGGELYGTTSAGGPGNYGTVFKVSTGMTAFSLTHFSHAAGWKPGGAPIQLANNDWYVPLQEGGAQGSGTLLRVSGNTKTVAVSFGEPLGEAPHGALTAVGGDYFGVTAFGGLNNRGTFYRFTPGESAETLSDLSISSGSLPEGPLVVGPDGFLYGVARERGALGHGAILRFARDGTRETLAAFTGVSGPVKGRLPHGPLTLGNDGNLYGVTEFGGASDRGTIFRLAPDGSVTTLHEFGASGPGEPIAGLMLAADGKFYGTTAEGGPSNVGTVFRFSPPGEVTILAEFNGSNGAYPCSRLLEAIDGTFYGTTSAGGSNGYGTVFILGRNGNFAALLHFSGSEGGTPGAEPIGDLCYGNDGMIYGCVASGGPKGGGGIFRITAFGPHAITDAPTFQLALSALRGRAQTGGQLTTFWFEYGFSPDLLLPLIGLPTGSSDTRGVTTFALPLPSLLPGQTIYYRAVASTLNGTATGAIRSFTAPSPLEGWKLNLFGDSNADDLADPDLDGLVNLLEYALLKDPKSPDPKAATTGPSNSPDQPRLTLTLQRDPDRNDITLLVEAAPALAGPWAVIASSENGGPFTGSAVIIGDSNSAGIKTVQIQDVVPVSGAPQRFLRVRAAH